MQNSTTNWNCIHDYAVRNRFKEYNRKHPREYAACFANLAQLIGLLQQFGKIGAFQVGFLRSEGKNVYRIAQTGVKHARETRLYVYIYETSQTIYVLTIGDKNSQADDIRQCHLIIKNINKVNNEHSG